VGVKHGFGVGNPDQGIQGGSFFFSPVKSGNHIIRFYYLNRDNAKDQDFNCGGVTAGSKGDAYGASLISNFLSSQLHTEFYGARSRFDFNAADGFQPNNDHAFDAKITYNSTPRPFKNRPSSFTLSGEIQDLGLFFKSLANPFLVTDRFGINLNSTWNWGIYAILQDSAIQIFFHDTGNDGSPGPQCLSKRSIVQDAAYIVGSNNTATIFIADND